jgi:hypothetical protein
MQVEVKACRRQDKLRKRERESERRSREISLFYGNEGMKMHKIILASFSGFFMGERKRNEHN